VLIDNGTVKGSIYLKGARFDDLTLSHHFTDLTKKDPVVLFAPNNSRERYFVDFGWVANQHEGQNIDMPNSETLWVANRKKLEINSPVTLSWKNRQNIEFLIKIEIDKNRLRPIDADLQIPNTEKFYNHTGWKPIIKFEKTMQDLLNYWRDKVKKQNYLVR
jgi:YidC/Oxa1 family membrane protein insertase